MNLLAQLSPGELWPILSAIAGIVFFSGQLVEKIRKNQFVSKEFCAEHERRVEDRLKDIKESILDIKHHLGVSERDGKEKV